jgi:hypothetical protein
MVIDIHCHAGKGDALQAPWTTEAPLEPYLERARAAGIARTVVFPLFRHDYQQAHAELADLIARHPNELVGFAKVHPERDRGRVEAIVREAVEEYGFRGLKIHGGEALPTREVFEVAQALRLPVLVDIVGRVEVIPLWAEQFPEVPLIIAHLGSFGDDWRVLQHMPTLLQRYPNVYADTSGVRFFDYLLEAVRMAGAEKLLFGSDGPLLHPGLELHKIRLLRLPPEAERKILGENARRLLGL